MCIDCERNLYVKHDKGCEFHGMIVCDGNLCQKLKNPKFRKKAFSQIKHSVLKITPICK